MIVRKTIQALALLYTSSAAYSCAIAAVRLAFPTCSHASLSLMVLLVASLTECYTRMVHKATTKRSSVSSDTEKSGPGAGV
jgi:hypothetical protein